MLFRDTLKILIHRLKFFFLKDTYLTRAAFRKKYRGVLSTENNLLANIWWNIINRYRDKQYSVSKFQALRRSKQI